MSARDDAVLVQLVDAASCQDAVVTIHAIRGDRKISHGSGFIWGGSGRSEVPPGLVVTNHHVVADSAPPSELADIDQGVDLTFEIELDRNKRVPATVLIKDRLLDLAILRIVDEGDRNFKMPTGIAHRPSTVPARAARALDYASLGEPVIRIGSPGVLGESEPLVGGFRAARDRIRELVTLGIVGGMEYPGSGPRRGTELLITDAYASGGNSGGPVIALADRCVIGITSGKSYLRSAQYLDQLLGEVMYRAGLSRDAIHAFFSDPEIAGMLSALRPSLDSIGLDVPAFWLDHLWSEYRGKGQEISYLRRASLGFDNEAVSFVRVQIPVDPSAPDKAQKTAILLDDPPPPNTPARAAGLRRGDLLLTFDDIPMEDSSSLIAALTSDIIGEEIELRVLRNGRAEILAVTPVEYRPKRFDDVR